MGANCGYLCGMTQLYRVSLRDSRSERFVGEAQVDAFEDDGPYPPPDVRQTAASTETRSGRCCTNRMSNAA